MTKKLLLLFFTCFGVFLTSPMQGMTEERAISILHTEGNTFLAFLRATPDVKQCSQDYVSRLVQHMTSYPACEDIWSTAILRVLGSSTNKNSHIIWQLQFEAAQAALGTDVVQRMATDLVFLILDKARLQSQTSIPVVSFDHMLGHYLPFLTILFDYGASFPLITIKTFSVIAALFEQHALHLAQNTPFRFQDIYLVAYHLLHDTLEKVGLVDEQQLSKEDISAYDEIICNNRPLLPLSSIVNTLRNRELNGARRFQVQSNYGPSLLNTKSLWKGRLFHVAYATIQYPDQAQVNEYLRRRACIAGYTIQEILFQGRKLPLSYDEISKALGNYQFNYISDHNTPTIDDIFNTLLQDDQKALQYYKTNKETILASLPQGNRSSIRELVLILDIAEEIRARCNSIFSRLKDASCSIQ